LITRTEFQKADAALVLGQFVEHRALSWWLVLVGAAVWLLFVGFGLLLAGDETW
jgi:hypothetical protein